jgi:hypothetical protein
MNRLVAAVNHRLAEHPTDLVGRSEKSDVLRGKLGRETADEYRRAHDLGVAGCMMRQGIARRWHIGRVKLKRFCTLNNIIGQSLWDCGGCHYNKKPNTRESRFHACIPHSLILSF